MELIEFKNKNDKFELAYPFLIKNKEINGLKNHRVLSDSVSIKKNPF